MYVRLGQRAEMSVVMISPWRNVSHSPDRSQTSADVAWEKEGGGGEDAFEVEIGEIVGVAGPVI